MMEHVVVVGASLAGVRTVEALRREGFAGRITVIGAEDEAPYDRPPLSKQFLADDWGDEKLALHRAGFDDPLTDFCLGVRAEALDTSRRKLLLSSGKSIDADVIVLATGTQARRLPFGGDLDGVFELRTIADARALRRALANARHAVVVGAGFIGMEVAASCRKKGLEVAVVEPLEAPLIRGLGPILGERVAKRHREAGVVFHLGTGVEGFEGEGAISGVRISSGKMLPADLVVVGVGATPATGWLEGAGLEIDNGIVCDARGSTGRDGIFAVGDCARWENANYPERPRFEHWTSAVEQSEVVARAILGQDAKGFAPIPYVWSDQFELRIAIAGELKPGDEMRIVLGKLEEERFLALFGRGDRLVAAVGFGRPRQLNACRRMIFEGTIFENAVAEFV